jgi:hypothetical protein
VHQRLLLVLPLYICGSHFGRLPYSCRQQQQQQQIDISSAYIEVRLHELTWI